MVSVLPLNDLSRIHAPIEEELIEALAAVVRSGRFIMGDNVKALESDFAALCGAQHAIGVSSGSDALLCALMALGVGPGDEVVTTPYTFFATVGAIHRLGAIPVFADIEADSFNLCPEDVRQKLSERTKAIVVVHLFGRCADMPAFEAIGREHGVAIVEDAAQSVCATDAQGRPAGGIGDVGCFSFFPAKNLGCLGDGGAITSNNAELAETMRILRVHGARVKYHHDLVGGNFRLDAMQAAALLVKLPHLEAWTQARCNNAAHYRELFAQRGLSDVITAPPAPEGRHVYNQFVIRAPQRDALRQALADAGISTAIYYPVPLHKQPCFAAVAPGYSLPASETAALETLALPVFPGMRADERERVADAIQGFYQASGEME